jgi:hypothetical protein
MRTPSRRLWIVAAATTLLGILTVGLLRLQISQTSDHLYSQIEPGVYLGSSVDRPPSGTQAVVNLCGKPDPYQVGPSLWIPIYEAGTDGAREKPTLDVLRRVVGFIEDQRRADRTIYVHCMVGVNRSAAFVTAYLMKKNGTGRDQTLAFLRKRRPAVELDPMLMQLLAQWEQELRTNSGVVPK